MSKTINKSVTVQARVAAKVKQDAENVLEQLGLSTSQAINLFFTEIARTRSVPVSLSLGEEIWLTEEQERSLGESIKDLQEGRYDVLDLNTDPNAVKKYLAQLTE